MKKTTALLLGGAAALVGTAPAVTAASASPAATAAQSYADLLSPIPNALALLQADEARLAEEPARVQLAQFHHHHHHYHHHHHHHHHGYFGFGVGVPAPYYGGGCYWTWGRPYWNGYRWVRRRVRVCD